MKLAKDRHLDMATKICTLPIRGDGRYMIEYKSGERINNGKLTETINHIFKDILPLYGYAVRDRQIELSGHILDVIGRRGISLAESEVGTGKTHAYLIAALLAKRGRINDFWLQGFYGMQNWTRAAYMPIVISTSGIALQKAIINDYIPELSCILLRHGIIKRPLTAVIRKGKRHYICEKRLRIFYESTDIVTRKLLMPYMNGDAPFDLTDIDSLTSHMKRYICVSEKCRINCPYRHNCRYREFLEHANGSAVDFQITNHNYFLADKRHRAEGKHQLLPDYQLAVIDEAHKFLQAARSMYGLELSETELCGLAQDVNVIHSGVSPRNINTRKNVYKLAEQGAILFKSMNDDISGISDEAERFSVSFDYDVVKCLGNISGISSDIALSSADCTVQGHYNEYKESTIYRLNELSERAYKLSKQNDLIYWFEKRMEGETKNKVFCAIPKDIDKRLYADVWNNIVPTILTSGTLSASGDFTRTKETLGLNLVPQSKMFSTSKPSPFDFKNNAMLYISESTPFPRNRNGRYIASIANEIKRLVTASHGRAAVLFTSYTVMGKVHKILNRQGLPYPIFSMGRGNINAIYQFKKSGNGVLLAAGALWEGIDIPGDSLSMLIIVKLPFAVPDPIGEYERSLYGGMKIYKTRAIIPDMLVKLKQGWGRLLRIENDTGVCAILDSRVRIGAPYRKLVINALPPCRVTSSIGTVRNFMLAKKEPHYFNG